MIVTADLKTGDKVITTPVDYATNGQQLREAGDPFPDHRLAAVKAKPLKAKKKTAK